MVIFKSNIKRLFRDKSNFVSMILVPVVFISMYFIFTSSSASGIKLAFVDDDQTQFTKNLEEKLGENFQIMTNEKEDLQTKLLRGDIDYGIYIKEGYTEALIEGESPVIEGYESMDTNRFKPLILFLEQYLSAVDTIAAASEKNREAFYNGLYSYQSGIFDANYSTTGGSPVQTAGAVGFLVMGIFFFSVRSATIIMKDKKVNIFNRLLTTPLGVKRYMIENILSFMVVSFIQIILILLVIQGIFNMPLGNSVFDLFIVLFLFAISCISFGITLVSLGKDMHKVSTISTLLVTPMLMIGGAFWPRELMPPILRNIGNFIPVTWAMKSIEGILFGASLQEIWLEMLIIIAFSILFLLLGTWKKEDIAK